MHMPLQGQKENGIAAESVCIKDFESREKFNDALIEKIDSYNLDLYCISRIFSCVAA